MKDFIIKVQVKAANEEIAELVRSEIAQAIQDADDSGEFGANTVEHSVDGVHEVGAPGDQIYIDAARKIHEREGEVEIDEGAVVSIGEDDGAYVQAWVWVPNSETGRAEDQ